MPIEVIVFDYSGTIAPRSAALTPELIRHAWRLAFASRPLPERELEAVPRRATIAEMCAHLTRDAIDRETAVRALAAAMDEAWPDPAPTPLAVQTVRALAARGYQCVLASNTRRLQATRNRSLHHAGIGMEFSHVILSSTIGVGKPDPAFYETVFQRISRHPSASLFVGDTLVKDVLEPRRLGATAVHLGPHPAACCTDTGDWITSIGDLPAWLERREH